MRFSACPVNPSLAAAFSWEVEEFDCTPVARWGFLAAERL
jgi:hypothetical protein